jgi:hypothetical protein
MKGKDIWVDERIDGWIRDGAEGLVDYSPTYSGKSLGNALGSGTRSRSDDVMRHAISTGPGNRCSTVPRKTGEDRNRGRRPEARNIQKNIMSV